MDSKQSIPQLCGVCQEAMTTHTMEVEDMRGTVLSFPCCVKCRYTATSRLSYERSEIELENQFLSRMKRPLHVVDGAKALAAQDHTRNQSYVHVPTALEDEKFTRQMAQADDRLNDIMHALEVME